MRHGRPYFLPIFDRLVRKAGAAATPPPPPPPPEIIGAVASPICHGASSRRRASRI